ncbi:MAG: T9SS type A sorting domain-containing protein [Crocinitomicaceae bacterium]
MKKIFTFLSVCFLGMSFAQTTEYTTGQTYGDPWTGWSTPIETGVNASSVNGADIYTFSGTNGQAYSVETYRQFTINSNDIDIYLSATCANSTVSVEYSTDNVSYTQIGSQTHGTGFVNQTLIIPTHDPVTSTFYLKIKVVGTWGSPSSLQLNNFKIDAVLNSGSSVSIAPTTTQNILEGANGTTLTASESPSAADSREWMYSTTSGSGYMPFSPAETGTSYTPNFASAGTYYVICESTFSGTPMNSNEVQVVVTAPSGIDEADAFQFVMTNSNIEIISTGLNYNLTIYNLSGQQITAEKNGTSFDFSGLQKGIYFVSVQTETGFTKTVKFVNH